MGEMSITAIEDAMKARIKAANDAGELAYKLRSVATYDAEFDDLDKLAAVVRALPAVWVVLARAGKPERKAADKWLVPVTMAVMVGARSVLNHEAARKAGATGETLVRILEMRLDNVVYRLGLAESRAQARQLVNHGHIAVNDKKTDIPSYVVKIGDVVSVRAGSRDNEYFKMMAKELSRKAPLPWLSLDAQQLSGKVVAAPSRADSDTGIDDQLIVEFYSR